MSPTASVVSPGELLALALHGEHDEVAAVGHHPRVGGLADEPGAGRDTTSAAPCVRA